MASARSFSIGLHGQHIPNNTINKDATSEGESNFCCFVCDVKVQGRHYALATCRTQSSRSRMIEKLGELVGERYMVVIYEDDVICKSCANIINVLDKLETEMHAKRNTILSFLEKKYSLTEGELVRDSKKIKLCQLPRVTKKEGNAAVPNGNAGNKCQRYNTWIQCNKCRYTTKCNSFMTYHTINRNTQNILCNEGDIQGSEDQSQRDNKCREQQTSTPIDANEQTENGSTTFARILNVSLLQNFT